MVYSNSFKTEIDARPCLKAIPATNKLAGIVEILPHHNNELTQRNQAKVRELYV